MGDIRIAIAGLGNCASSLIQGIYYYNGRDNVIGLMHYDLGGYFPSDIKVVAAFDIDQRKVGKDIGEAIFSPPNCTKVFQEDIPSIGVPVSMGKILDGFSSHMAGYLQDQTFVLSKEKEPEKSSVIEALISSKADMLVNYVPVGSENAARFYAECALEANVAFINCMPVFIASDGRWGDAFLKKKIPIIGDDIKSQLGATIVHRVLARLFHERGVKIDNMYQLNVGGNTDFLNMLSRDRLRNKKISKTNAVQSILKEKMLEDNIHIGPSDYIPWLKDNKLCFLRIEGRIFGDIPINAELRLSVEDSPNSAGIVIDAIRCCKLALDRNIGGPLTSISAYAMKHPPLQLSDHKAREFVESFITGQAER